MSNTDTLHWDLTLRFRDKEKAKGFINILMEEEVDYDFTVDSIFEETYTVYRVEVHNMLYGHNLVNIATYLADIELEDDSFIHLTEEGANSVAEVLENPPPVNEKLKQAAKDYFRKAAINGSGDTGARGG